MIEGLLLLEAVNLAVSWTVLGFKLLPEVKLNTVLFHLNAKRGNSGKGKVQCLTCRSIVNDHIHS